MLRRNLRSLSLIGGIVLALLFFYVNPLALNEHAAKVLAIAALMVFWWITEALPLPAVALVPIVLFPLLNIASLEETTAPYAHPIIFLFMGGFMIGLAIEKWNLHKRIALSIVRLTGTSGNKIVLGFILATGLLSMWLSNTATTMMMFPIALSVIHVMKTNENVGGNIGNFSITLLMAIAYAANFGGIATIIGTPPNVAFVGFMEKKYAYSIDFTSWMLLCLPIAILLMMSLYWVMTRLLYPNHIKSSEATRKLIHDELNELGPLSVAEKRVLIIFSITAFLWITKALINKIGFIKLDDSIIAMMGALALFIMPSGMKNGKGSVLLDWTDTKNMAWGILILFGGGITLAHSLETAGLIEQLGQWLAKFSGNGLMLIFTITVISIFLSEVMSNVAQVIVFAPVIAGLADALGMNPLMLGIPMTLAASCAGMLPMGTPPNAIVFSSGLIRLHHMTTTGFIMNLISIFLITLFSWFLLPLIM
jgi:sodium-dependent dicarboxylate transporter 2/3/5